MYLPPMTLGLWRGANHTVQPPHDEGHHMDLAGTDVAALTSNDVGVAVLRDHDTGASAILLSADAGAALLDFLGNLPLGHHLIEDGYDPYGVDVIAAIRGMLPA